MSFCVLMASSASLKDGFVIAQVTVAMVQMKNHVVVRASTRQKLKDSIHDTLPIDLFTRQSELFEIGMFNVD